MTLPSGAQISWTYGPGDSGGRIVTSRTVTVNGVSPTWQYSYSRSLYGAITSAVVTDPSFNDTQYTCLTSSNFPAPPPCFIASAQYYQGSYTSGTLLKTISTDYTSYSLDSDNYYAQIYVPIRETTTWNQQNLVRKVETDWDTTSLAYSGRTGTFTWQNPVERREFDWGTGSPGALLKRTDYTYLHLQNSAYLITNIARSPHQCHRL